MDPERKFSVFRRVLGDFFGVEAFFPGCFIGGSGSSLLKKPFRKVKQGGKMKLMKLMKLSWIQRLFQHTFGTHP